MKQKRNEQPLKLYINVIVLMPDVSNDWSQVIQSLLLESLRTYMWMLGKANN